MSFASFANSGAFKKVCSGVFKSVDKNGDGIADESELLIAMCKMHFKLAKKVPGVTEPPTAEKIQEKMKEYDIDLSGGLNQDEFYSFARKWFNQEGVIFVGRMLLTAFIGMVILPEGAGLLQQGTPIVKHMPKRLFKVLFGVAFKLFASRVPGGA